MIKQRLAVGSLVVTLAGLAMLKGFESGAVMQTDAYLDTGNVPTICAGHTKGVFIGQKATIEQCEAWLIEDTSEAGRAIKRCTTAHVTQLQYNVLNSFVVNVGGGAYCHSELLRKLNAGDCRGAAREFNAAPQIDRATGKPVIWTGKAIKDRSNGAVLLATGDSVKKWTTDNGRPLAGLILRRAKERAAFEGDCE